MEIRTVILSLLLAGSLALFFLAFLDASLGDESRVPAISVPEATRIVLEEFPNARILEIELEGEDGRLVYEVELVTADGQKREIRVNAATGRIEKVEQD